MASHAGIPVRARRSYGSTFSQSPAAPGYAVESHGILLQALAYRLEELRFRQTFASLSLLDAMPVLKVQIRSLSPDDTDRKMLLALFADVARHAHCLNSLPEHKAAFWRYMLQFNVLSRPAVVSQGAFIFTRKSEFRVADFPQFAVEFSVRSGAAVNVSLGEELFAFMTTPPAYYHVQGQVAMGFSFANCELTVASLEIVERFLDRVFAHPGRQYDIKSLDLSDNAMNPLELVVVARIVENIRKRVYQIEELHLDAIVPKICLNDYRPPVETPREFLDIVRAAFEVDTKPLPDGLDPSSPSRLSKISLSRNVVCPKFFATMFSALRYGCPLEEDTSIYTVSQYRYAETSVESWRWLAFGLFYPRPKRFASKFKLRAIGKLNFSPMAIKILISTLRNPVTELVYGGKSGQCRSVVTDILMVCTVKRGAQIEIFEAGSPTEAIRTETLRERSELEAVCERSDGSMCVVIPGVGLGWVHPEFVESIEHESLESCRSEQDGWYDVTLGVSEVLQHLDDLRPLLSMIGRQLWSLTFDFSYAIGGGISDQLRLVYPMFSTQTLTQIVGAHCVKLKRLTFNSPSTTEISGLLDALDGGELGSRLQVLNLYDAGGCFDDGAAVRLFTLLSKTTNPPALQELRLSGCRTSPQGLVTLSDALQVNRTLALIELDGTKFNGTDLKRNRGRFDAAVQGQLLDTSVLMETKLAFLSVVACDSQPTEGKTTSALNALDPSVLTQIFEFAATREVRRMIAWNEDFKRLDSHR